MYDPGGIQTTAPINKASRQVARPQQRVRLEYVTETVRAVGKGLGH
jgi:hypothetical protein